MTIKFFGISLLQKITILGGGRQFAPHKLTNRVNWTDSQKWHKMVAVAVVKKRFSDVFRTAIFFIMFLVSERSIFCGKIPKFRVLHNFGSA